MRTMCPERMLTVKQGYLEKKTLYLLLFVLQNTNWLEYYWPNYRVKLS